MHGPEPLPADRGVLPPLGRVPHAHEAADGQHGLGMGPPAGGRIRPLHARPALAVPLDRLPEPSAPRPRIPRPGGAFPPATRLMEADLRRLPPPGHVPPSEAVGPQVADP